MGELRYKEQYARALRFFERLMQLKNVGSDYRNPEEMTPDELARYGLTTSDRDRIKEWMKQIPQDALTVDVTPVSEIFTKWIQASVNDSPDYDDAIYTFFQHCYHVKDWVKNDPVAGNSLGLKVETFINRSKALSLCADICNGSKHLLLTSKRSGYEPKITGYTFKFNPAINSAIDSDKSERRVTLAGATIEHGGNDLDVFELAEQCMKEWKTFLGE